MGLLHGQRLKAKRTNKNRPRHTERHLERQRQNKVTYESIRYTREATITGPRGNKRIRNNTENKGLRLLFLFVFLSSCISCVTQNNVLLSSKTNLHSNPGFVTDPGP